jgi:hypothetical protein
MSDEEMVMSDYTIETIHDDGNVDVRFPDGSWARIKTSDAMSQEEFDAEVWNYKPAPTTSAPSFLRENGTGTASPLPVGGFDDEEIVNPQWLDDRLDAYGLVNAQLEYITENGIEAWQAHVAEIKAQYPKE